jgi:hypothetical protein
MRPSLRAKSVGWVERSDTHRPYAPALMGIASLHPSYQIHLRILARCARGLLEVCPRKLRGRGECRAPAGTRGLVCKMHSRMRTRAYRYSRSSPAFPAPEKRGVGHRHERWGGLRWTRQRQAREVFAGRTFRERASRADERRLNAFAISQVVLLSGISLLGLAALVAVCPSGC